MISSEALRFARRSKERAVRANRFDFTMCHVILFEREGHRIATVRTPIPDPDQALLAVRFGAEAWGAEAVAVICDTNYNKSDSGMLSPATGKPWQPGEMERILHAMGPDNPYVGEAIIVYRTTMDDIDAITLPYRIDRAHRTVKWEGSKTILAPGGSMPESITDSLAGDPAYPAALRLYETLTGQQAPDDAREVLDREALKRLRDLGYEVKWEAPP